MFEKKLEKQRSREVKVYEKQNTVKKRNCMKTIIDNCSDQFKTIAPPKVNESAMNKVFDNMYITNVEKRLRELNTPSDTDRKRWIWELIQNAKDTIANDPRRDGINIRIEIEGDTVRFRHDGSPFTPEARFGLLYKYSNDKESQESTGRFGTGFLTTHCLSKIVTIESNMFSNAEHTELCGFEVTMFRDGLIKQELIEGLQKMRDSEKFFEQTFDWTSFIYHVNSDSGRAAIQMGVENFRENIAQTMLFCKEIKTIELDDNGKTTTIIRRPEEVLTEGIKLAEYEIKGQETLTRRFIYTHFENYNKELSDRYRTDRNIRIDVAFEVDEKNQLISHEGKTAHFCVLPLVGIENQLNEPAIINSPDFEPDTERQSLILNGQTWNEEKDVITEAGINQLIYKSVIPLYEKLVSYLTSNNYGKLYYLASGLNQTKSHKELDKEWYLPNVIQEYRDVLLKYPVVMSYDRTKVMPLSECIIIKETKEEDEDVLYDLLTELYPSRLVIDNHEWASILWKSGLNLWDTNDFCEDIEKKSNWGSISLASKSIKVWYNELLQYVQDYDERLLKDHALLPNMNGELLKKDQENFKQGENVSFFVIGLLSSLGKDVKPILLHEDVTAVSLNSKYNSQSYSADINQLAKAIIDSDTELHKITKLLPLLSVVPNKTDKYKPEFLNRRNDFFRICKALYQLNEASPVCDNNLLEDAWKETDEWLVTNILNSLKVLGSLSKLPNGLDAKWLNSTVKSLNVQTEKLNVFAVLPNQNGNFCCQKDLFEDSGIPEELKDEIFDTVGINYKNILLHKDIKAADFAVVQKKTISTFASELNDAVTESSNRNLGNEFNGHFHKFTKDTIYGVASYMVRLLPKNKETALYKNQSSLLSIAQAFNLAEGLIGYIEYDNSNLWNKISFYAVCDIWEKIEEFSTVSELCTFVKKGESEVLQLLNYYYAYQETADINFDSDKIIPNQNGDLQSKNDLYREEDDINDTLKNIINKLSEVDDKVVDLRSQLVDKRVVIKLDKVRNEKYAYGLIDESIDRLYQIPAKWVEESYIIASQMLIEEWGDRHKGLFEENFPRVFPNKEKILMNVVWKKEKRELMMTVSTRLSEEQLRIIIDNSTEIGDLSAKVKDLETENDLLKQKLAKFENQHSGLINSIHTFAQDELNLQFGRVIERDGLSQEEQINAHKEAEQVVREKLENDGYDCSNWILSVNQVDNIISPDGESINLVIKSAKGGYIYLSATDFEFLTSNSNNVLMVWDGKNVHSVTANDIFNKDSNVNLIFDTEYTTKHYFAALSKVFQYIKRTTFAVKNPSYNPYDTIKSFGMDSKTEGIQDLFVDNDL